MFSPVLFGVLVCVGTEFRHCTYCTGNLYLGSMVFRGYHTKSEYL